MRLIKSIVDHTRSMYESNAPSLLRSAALVVMLCVLIDHNCSHQSQEQLE
jgi:hypothetical protein